MDDPFKKLRPLPDSENNNIMADVPTSTFSLLSLPPELLCHVLEALDARSLAIIATACKRFRDVDPQSPLMRITDKVARDTLYSRRGQALAERWRNYTWPQRLLIEEADSAFDIDRCTQQNFDFQPDMKNKRIATVSLKGMGPKLLVSKQCTLDRPLLRWHLRVTGNTAVEFGVIPVGLEDEQRALHKCMTVVPSVDERPVGFCSNITTGSQQVMRIPVHKGTEVELLATRGQVEFIITQPPPDPNLTAKSAEAKDVPSRAPAEVRFIHTFSYDWPVKLAATTWAHGRYDVLHHVPLPPPPPPPSPPTKTIATQTSPRVSADSEQPGGASE